MNKVDVIVIGGGQSGLAIGYYLRRTGFSYIILDNQEQSGGAWLHTWKSLRLFSPAQWSSLPGMIMGGGSNYYPTKFETIAYLKAYEAKYQLPVRRSVEVLQVLKVGEEFQLQTTDGLYSCKALINATGAFSNPYIPETTGREKFKGTVIHSCAYQSPETFDGKRVAVVGEGNSGAQILAEVSKIGQTIWVTQKEPRFLPDHIDGRYLFDAATQLYEAQKAGKQFKPPSLGDIVMVDTVKDARSRNVLASFGPFDHFTEDSIVLVDGHEEKIDAVIFCTGFKPALKHLTGIGVKMENGKPVTERTRCTSIAGLWFVGYGNWTGFASATLIGVGRSAKKPLKR